MTKTHVRRSPEEIIAELEAKIAAVKARAASKVAKAAPEGAAFITAARAVRKAQEAAQGAKNMAMDRALEAALASLSIHAVQAGLRLPVRRERKGGRRRKTASVSETRT